MFSWTYIHTLKPVRPDRECEQTKLGQFRYRAAAMPTRMLDSVNNVMQP